MRMHTKISGVALVMTVVTALVACGDDDSAAPAITEEPDAATPDVNAADAADANVPMLPPGCDGTKSPQEDACVIDEAAGVFVAPSGDDTAGQGTKTAPYKTFAKSIVVAKATGKRVYACAATYAEALVLDNTSDGVSLYGGLACPGGDAGAAWSYTGTRAVLAPSAAGYALRTEGLTKAVALEDLELDAKDGVMPGDSSIAAFVKTSANVTFRRVKLVAGNGVTGAAGTAAVTNHTAQTRDGVAGATNAAATARACTCANANTSTGAIGGTPNATNAGPGGAGTSNPATTVDPSFPDHDGAAGTGAVLGGAVCKEGHIGANGAAATAAAGATVLGAIGQAGWTGQAGGNGAAGKPGEGGGGGGGGQTAGGGGGACGGCGGGGGGGGQAGGSSIAIVASGSVTTFVASLFVTGNAGAGGAGATGEVGQSGGIGGTTTGNACAGGNGGNSAGGGGGGGGAGGLSAGIVYTGGSPPVIDAQPVTAADTLAAVTLGTPGDGGGLGSGGGPAATNAVVGLAGADATSGIAGVAKAVLPLTTP